MAHNNTLEREHIRQIIKDSARFYYDPGEATNAPGATRSPLFIMLKGSSGNPL